MTYLDNIREGGHWEIDPHSQCSDLSLDSVLDDLNHRLAEEPLPLRREVTLKLIIEGAMELARRTDAPLAQCLDTSMIWLYG
jgi:hypothetical protein